MGAGVGDGGKLGRFHSGDRSGQEGAVRDVVLPDRGHDQDDCTSLTVTWSRSLRESLRKGSMLGSRSIVAKRFDLSACVMWSRMMDA